MVICEGCPNKTQEVKLIETICLRVTYAVCDDCYIMFLRKNPPFCLMENTYCTWCSLQEFMTKNYRIFEVN